jgi:hypothetical protein
MNLVCAGGGETVSSNPEVSGAAHAFPQRAGFPTPLTNGTSYVHHDDGEYEGEDDLWGGVVLKPHAVRLVVVGSKSV